MAENNEQKSNEKNDIRELEDTYRKFLRLYERLAADRLTVVKQGETLCKIIDELKAETNLATEFKVYVRRDVVDTMKLATAETSKKLRESIKETVASEFADALEDLKVETKNSIEVLRKHNREKEEEYSWITYLIIFMGILVFFVTMYTAIKVYRYVPNSYLTRDQLVIYDNGLNWNSLLRKISKKDRDRVVGLVIGKYPAEKDSLEWIRQQDPRLDWPEVKKKYDEQGGNKKGKKK